MQKEAPRLAEENGWPDREETGTSQDLLLPPGGADARILELEEGQSGGKKWVQSLGGLVLAFAVLGCLAIAWNYSRSDFRSSEINATIDLSEKTNEAKLKLVNSILGKEIPNLDFWEGMTDDAVAEQAKFDDDKYKLIIPKKNLLYALTQIKAAFPDIHFAHYKDDEAKVNKDGSVSINVRATGTNTGAPFAPMPGWPKVEHTDKEVANCPEEFTFFFNEEGKVNKWRIKLLPGGKFMGPVGLYLLVGGKPPPKED